jgi:hypothetical protein
MLVLITKMIRGHAWDSIGLVIDMGCSLCVMVDEWSSD